jgi:hypothetical protein
LYFDKEATIDEKGYRCIFRIILGLRGCFNKEIVIENEYSVCKQKVKKGLNQEVATKKIIV